MSWAHHTLPDGRDAASTLAHTGDRPACPEQIDRGRRRELAQDHDGPHICAGQTFALVDGERSDA